MKKRILGLISASLILAATRFTDTPENKIIPVAGNAPATLKTSNGCWDINHIIVNRGDSVLNIPASIWYYSEYGIPPAGILDTLPSYHLLDFSFPEIADQNYLNNEERTFSVVTDDYIYLYSTHPVSIASDLPEITRTDSMTTPAGFITCCILDGKELLVVNEIDSVNYSYSFYDFNLDLKTQRFLHLKPEKIEASYNTFYLICGSEAGLNIFIMIDQMQHVVTFRDTLPPEASNVKEILQDYSAYYFLSSPGDSITYLTQLHTSVSLISTTVVLPNAGLNAAESYPNARFILQPAADSSANMLSRQLLLFHAPTGIFSDTFFINKKVISLYYKPDTYGSEEYVMFGEESPAANDKVFFLRDNLTKVDSINCGANPTWFGDDVRCYVGIEEIEKNLSIKVHPNPADQQVSIQVTGLAKDKNYLFEVLDESGKLLWSQTILSKQEYQIPLQKFPKGILLLRVNTGSKMVTKRIMKI